jgi:hypothetical protein
LTFLLGSFKPHSLYALRGQGEQRIALFSPPSLIINGFVPLMIKDGGGFADSSICKNSVVLA